MSPSKKKETIQYALINFSNNLYEIHDNSKVVSTDGHNCILKYGGASYAGVIVDVNDSKQELQELREKLENEHQQTSYKTDETITININITKNVNKHKDHVVNENDMERNDVYLDFSEQEAHVENIIESYEGDIVGNHVFAEKIDNTKEIINEQETLGTNKHIENFEQEMNSNDTVLDLSNFTFGNAYVHLNRSSRSLCNSFDENRFDANCIYLEEQIQSQHEEFSGVNSTDGREYNEDSDDSVNDCNYEPGSESSDEELDLQERSTKKSVEDPKQNVSVLNISNNLNTTGLRPCDEEKMFVNKSLGRSGDNKYNFCIFCHTKQLKISRHFQNKHKNEEAVKRFLQLPKNCVERNKCIADLRKKGNYLFNSDNNFNDGELIVTRRPNKSHSRNASYYRACPKCKAFFSKKTLRVHFKACANPSKKFSNVITFSKKVMPRIHEKASKRVRQELFPPLRHDNITCAIRYDELVIIYANKMVKNYKNVRHFEMIRQRIRLIGRFLVRVRSLNAEITDLRSVYDPKYIDITDQAINSEAGLNELTDIYATPTVASNLGTLLKKIGNILIAECIKTHNLEKKTQTENFLLLLTDEINTGINRTVAESQFQTQRRKVVDLPSTEDIERLHSYITVRRNETFHKLLLGFSLEAWNQLCQYTLVCILVFNRRRAGELERVMIEDFNSYHGIDDKDLFQSLSEENRVLANKYVRFLIRGKLNRNVPVLLDKNLLACLKLILKHRRDAKVPDSNPYLFGMHSNDPSIPKYFRACNLLRQFSEECGASHPERLRGTKLRKHIATTCVTLNLNENDISDLANFMGHKKDIHKSYYRQSVAHKDILQLSKLLQVAQGGIEEPGASSDEEMEETNEVANAPTNSPEIFNGKKKRSTSPYGSVKRRKWSEEEKSIVLDTFQNQIKRRQLPSLKEIGNLIGRTTCLKARTPAQVKTWIHNQFQKT